MVLLVEILHFFAGHSRAFLDAIVGGRTDNDHLNHLCVIRTAMAVTDGKIPDTDSNMTTITGKLAQRWKIQKSRFFI